MIGILVTVLSLGFLGYRVYQKSAVTNEAETLEKERVQLSNEVIQYQNNEIMEAVNAKKLIQELTASTVVWSRVIQDIKGVIPMTKTGVPLVDVMSYSGSSNNQLSLSMKTASTSKEPYVDAADLIKAFNDSTRFVDSFVPALSSGLDLDGNEILSFMMTTKYVKSDIDAPAPVVAPVVEEKPATAPVSTTKITR